MIANATPNRNDNEQGEVGWPWLWAAVIGLAILVFTTPGCMFAAGAAAGGAAGYVVGHEAGEEDDD